MAENTAGQKELTTVSFAELSKFCGYKRPADVKKWCQRNGIKHFLDKDRRPITTQAAIDAALLGDSSASSESKFRLPHEVPKGQYRPPGRPM